MRFNSLLFASAAAGAAVSNGAVSDAEIVDTILESPWLLPESRMCSIMLKDSPELAVLTNSYIVHKAVSARFNSLQKRQGGGLASLLSGLAPAAGGRFGDATANPANAPKSAVPETQELPSEWGEGTKRVKVRYGPYRIPSVDVRLASPLLILND
jgi:hypothetical protein